MWICAIIYDVVVCGFVKVTWTLLEGVFLPIQGFPIP